MKNCVILLTDEAIEIKRAQNRYFYWIWNWIEYSDFGYDFCFFLTLLQKIETWVQCTILFWENAVIIVERWNDERGKKKRVENFPKDKRSKKKTSHVLVLIELKKVERNSFRFFHRCKFWTCCWKVHPSQTDIPM